jgi:hypothetical protein
MRQWERPRWSGKALRARSQWVCGLVGLGLAAGARAGQCPSAPELGGPLISGTTAYVGGTHVWTDYVYDDRGKNTNGVFGGDQTYPPAPYPGNTADLIQLQVGTGAGGALTVTALLETLVPDADAAVGVGFDIDQNSLTGAPAVPGGQWTTFPGTALGLEYVAMLDSYTGTATLLQYVLGAWQTVATHPLAVDRDCNTLRATYDELTPGPHTFRVVGRAGWSDASGSWANGAHPIDDLAYVVGEDPVTDPHLALYQQVPQIYQPRQDNIQSDILGGLADPAPAVAAIALGTGQTQLHPPVDVHTPGIYTFLYHSALDLGEGIRNAQFAGPYQPYVVYIASTIADDPPPAVIFMRARATGTATACRTRATTAPMPPTPARRIAAASTARHRTASETPASAETCRATASATAWTRTR